MAKDETPVTGLLNFKALFRASLETERILFTVGEHECWVDLLPLGDADLDEYEVHGFDYEVDLATRRPILKKIDTAARKRFLVTRCLVGWSLAKYTPKTGKWTTEVHSENARDRREQVERMDLTGEFGRWLHEQCLRVNGLQEEQEKNSPEPSSS